MRNIAAAFLILFGLSTTTLAQELPEGVELETGRYQLGVSDQLAILLDTKTGQTWRFLAGGHWTPLFFDEATKPWRGDTILPPSVDLEHVVQEQRRKQARSELQALSEQQARNEQQAPSELLARSEPEARKSERHAQTEAQPPTEPAAESAWKARLEAPTPKPLTLSDSDLTLSLQRLAEQETQRLAMAEPTPLTLSDPYLTSKLRTLAVQDLQRLADATEPRG